MTTLVVEREFRVQTRRTCWFLEEAGGNNRGSAVGAVKARGGLKRAPVRPVDQLGSRGVRKPRVVSRHDPKRPGSPKGGAGDISLLLSPGPSSGVPMCSCITSNSDAKLYIPCSRMERCERVSERSSTASFRAWASRRRREGAVTGFRRVDELLFGPSPKKRRIVHAPCPEGSPEAPRRAHHRRLWRPRPPI